MKKNREILELDRTINMLIKHSDNKKKSEFSERINYLISLKKQLLLHDVGNCAKLQSEVDSRRKQITDINQWTEILLAYRHKIRDRVLWSMIADINNRTTD